MQIQMNIKIDKNLKNDVDSICKQLGISSTDAVRIFFNKIKMVNGLPFNVIITKQPKQIKKTNIGDLKLKPEVIEGILEDEKHLNELPSFSDYDEAINYLHNLTPTIDNKLTLINKINS